MPTVENGSQITSLTATRAVAAVLVFVHHFGSGVFPFRLSPRLSQGGNIAVSYFFVLSGFVLFLSYHNRQTSYGGYLRKRLARILPAYFVALSLTVGALVAIFHYDVLSARAVKEIVFSALCIQSFVPSYPLSLNTPGWSISVEMFFYFLFPLLLAARKRSATLFTIVTAVLFVASQYFHLKYYPDRYALGDNIVDTVFFSPVIHLSQFLVGMTAGAIFVKRRDKAVKRGWMPLLLFAAIIAAIALRPANVSYQVGLIAPLFAWFIIEVAVNDPAVLRHRALVYLGEISYGIYILQYPVYQLLNYLNEQYLHIQPGYFFYGALAVLVVCAAACYQFVERPAGKWVNRL